MDNLTFGQYIRQERKRYKITQEGIAAFLGTTKATISRWENGQIEASKIPFAAILALTIYLCLDPKIVLSLLPIDKTEEEIKETADTIHTLAANFLASRYTRNNEPGGYIKVHGPEETMCIICLNTKVYTPDMINNIKSFIDYTLSKKEKSL